MTNFACISIDVDTLSSIYKGRGCTRSGGYTFVELRQGLETIDHFFHSYPIKTTLFMVGNDFLFFENHPAIKAMHRSGHEFANHSMTHPQGFRWLSAKEKAEEITKMGGICEEITGKRPVGFRSPGWNIDDSVIPVLQKLGYRYDSSVFPTFLMPLMKFSHWASMYTQVKSDRTTMGMWRYMFAPIKPYQTSQSTLARSGESNLIEFPVSVTPVLRVPFFATLLLFTGIWFYKNLYRRIRQNNLPIHFQMHLSDFVDYSQPELQEQMPNQNQGTYVPQALHTSLAKKIEVFREMIDTIAADYSFLTLEEWSQRIESEA